MFKQLLSGAILTVSLAVSANAEEVERTFVRQGLTVAEPTGTDFPLAPEARTESVNELVALLDRVRDSDKGTPVTVRALTLQEVVRSRAWRQDVAYQLQRLFP